MSKSVIDVKCKTKNQRSEKNKMSIMEPFLPIISKHTHIFIVALTLNIFLKNHPILSIRKVEVKPRPV